MVPVHLPSKFTPGEDSIERLVSGPGIEILAHRYPHPRRRSNRELGFFVVAATVVVDCIEGCLHRLRTTLAELMRNEESKINRMAVLIQGTATSRSVTQIRFRGIGKPGMCLQNSCPVLSHPARNRGQGAQIEGLSLSKKLGGVGL